MFNFKKKATIHPLTAMGNQRDAALAVFIQAKESLAGVQTEICNYLDNVDEQMAALTADRAAAELLLDTNGTTLYNIIRVLGE